MHLGAQAALAVAVAGLALLPSPAAAATSKPKNAILLSSVQSLTLRAGKMTTHRRVAAVPQLACAASPQRICDLYTVDTMRCTNQGSGYDDQDIQWSCTASLPPELKLGATEVVCEGYSSGDDPYILKGSCAVEYRLLLTDYGDRKYPELAGGGSGWFGASGRSSWLFWAVFAAVVVWIVWSAYRADGAGRPGGNRGGGGGFWGGGGGGGPGFDPGNDPPPPYPGTKPGSSQQEGWRPGFLSGLAGGAAAGYFAGSRNNNNNRNYYNDGFGGGRPYDGGGGWGGGGGPSRRSGSPSSRPVSSARHDSTGFGSTRRR